MTEEEAENQVKSVWVGGERVRKKKGFRKIRKSKRKWKEGIHTHKGERR